MVIFAMPIRALLNLKFSRENQRINFRFVCYIHIKNFKAVEFCHCMTQFAKRFHLQFSGFILSRFKILESQSFARKNNFFLSGKLISVQLRAGHSLCNNLLTSLSRFCLVSRLCPVFTWDEFFRDVFQDLFVQNCLSKQLFRQCGQALC